MSARFAGDWTKISHFRVPRNWQRDDRLNSLQPLLDTVDDACMGFYKVVKARRWATVIDGGHRNVRAVVTPGSTGKKSHTHKAPLLKQGTLHCSDMHASKGHTVKPCLSSKTWPIKSFIFAYFVSCREASRGNRYTRRRLSGMCVAELSMPDTCSGGFWSHNWRSFSCI